MDYNIIIQKIAIWALPLIFAITLHEVAHGYIASWFGDQTARLSGRLSLNPIKHIDPIGTILLPLIMIIARSNFIFGWAKPVPVDPRNLRNPRRDMALVALGGPIANLLMAIFWAGILKLGTLLSNDGNQWFGPFMVLTGSAGVLINIVLAVLNLIPIPPLDGSKVLASILPRRAAYYYYQLEPYGLIILIVLLFSRVLNIILIPPVILSLKLIESLFGVNVLINI